MKGGKARLPRRSLLQHLPVRIQTRLHDVARATRLRRHWRFCDAAPIALVGTHDLSPSGAPRVALDVAQVLHSAGYRIVVVSMADGPLRADFERLGALILIDLLPARRRPYLRRLAARAEIAFVNTYMAAALVDAWAEHVPTCWYLHELSAFADLAATGIFDVPLKGAARIWAGSELCARLVRPYRDDVVVLPYGLEPIREVPGWGPDKRGDNLLRIAVFGSIEPRKGQDLALDGLAMLDPADRTQIRLRVYGRPLDPVFARDVMQRCDAIPEASFEGELDHAGYRTALVDNDAILVSSREDTAPLTSIDALSAGRILLLTHAIGTSAWLEDGVDALIEEQADAAGMARLFQRALVARPRAAEISIAAKARFEAVFSRGAFVRRVSAEIVLAKSAT